VRCRPDKHILHKPREEHPPRSCAMGGLSDRPHSHASKPPRSRRHGKSANLGTNESAVATALEPEPEPEPEPKPEPGAGPEPAHATAHTPNVVDQLISSLLDSGRGNGRQRDRRSLSQQLASAVGGADEVMAQYGAGRKPGLIMSAPAERFAVAGCESRGCSVSVAPLHMTHARARCAPAR
jgi:hypothetical protein